MKIIDPNLIVADQLNVPEFFATDVGLVEDAGGGNCRTIRCIKRRGILWPVYSLVSPTDNLIRQCAAVQAAAAEIQEKYRSAQTH